jgi:hypothetical protein
VEELMDDAPENEAGIKFADYVLEHFVLPTCKIVLLFVFLA